MFLNQIKANLLILFTLPILLLLFFSGYLNNEEATMSTIDKDGWLHTGDVVYFDQEGYLHISDRLKDIIKYKGYQVSNFWINK